jgi:hypothetical protein
MNDEVKTTCFYFIVPRSYFIVPPSSFLVCRVFDFFGQDVARVVNGFVCVCE